LGHSVECYAESYFAECHIFIVIPIVAMPIVIVSSVVAPGRETGKYSFLFLNCVFLWQQVKFEVTQEKQLFLKTSLELMISYRNTKVNLIIIFVNGPIS
jgi:hypothetical protein